MKQNLITQTVIIHEETASLFETKMNEALAKMSNPQIKFQDSVPFCAYITYQIEQKISETAEDEYVEKTGEHACCGDCPYIKLSEDKRVKFHTCKYNEYAIKVTTPACELYYQRLFNGTLNKEA